MQRAVRDGHHQQVGIVDAQRRSSHGFDYVLRRGRVAGQRCDRHHPRPASGASSVTAGPSALHLLQPIAELLDSLVHLGE